MSLISTSVATHEGVFAENQVAGNEVARSREELAKVRRNFKIKAIALCIFATLLALGAIAVVGISGFAAVGLGLFMALNASLFCDIAKSYKNEIWDISDRMEQLVVTKEIEMEPMQSPNRIG